MDAATFLLLLGPTALFFVLALAVVLFLGRRRGLMTTMETDGPEAPARPWWGSPVLWLGVCAVLALLGLFVAPHLFGGVFLFLPFLWIVRPRRREPHS